MTTAAYTVTLRPPHESGRDPITKTLRVKGATQATAQALDLAARASRLYGVEYRVGRVDPN